jgi:hypothetical protein
MPNRRASGSHQTDTIWDAKTVLSIVNLARGTITCVGYAPSRGRRCQNPISEANRTAIIAVLNDLATEYPSTRRMRADLWKIAEMGLCKRNHQNQVDNVVEKWSDSLRHEKQRLRNSGINPPQERSRQPSGVENHTSNRGSTFSNHTPSSQASSHNHVELANQIRGLLVRRRSDIPSSIRREIERICSAAERSPSPPLVSSESPDSESWRDSAASSDSEETTANDSSSEETESRASASTLSSARSSTSLSSSSNFVPSLSTASSSTFVDQSSSNRPERRCRLRHVRRRPLAENCAICTDACDTTRPTTLVWCKTECGRSVHRECFETWQATCLALRRRVRCPIWYVLFSFVWFTQVADSQGSRADWAGSCACDYILPIPVE